jgi:hypothetical protein
MNAALLYVRLIPMATKLCAEEKIRDVPPAEVKASRDLIG